MKATLTTWALLLWAAAFYHPTHSSSPEPGACRASPPEPGACRASPPEPGACRASPPEPGTRRLPRADAARRTILDISHAYRPDLPQFGLPGSVGRVVEQVSSMRNGSQANVSRIRMGVHTGTHVDAPSHFFQHHHDAGFHVDTLDLHTLNGPVLLVDALRDTNLTAEAMEFLHIPYGVERVLFRTSNTDRGLMWKREFDSSYVGFTTEGAKWLKENTMIKLVGIDYLSAAAYEHLSPAHLVFLEDKDIILVEGLNLDGIEVGLYDLHCLPLKLPTSDGSPIRCILEI